MGFTYEPRTYDLTFADGALEGLNVKVRGLSFGAYKSAMKLIASLEEAENLAAEAEITDELLPVLAKSITWWDWDGHPTTADSLRELSPDDLASFANAWRDAVAGVSAPLSEGSENGPMSDLPMEVLNQAS
jgi:hypothetical protein